MVYFLAQLLVMLVGYCFYDPAQFKHCSLIIPTKITQHKQLAIPTTEETHFLLYLLDFFFFFLKRFQQHFQLSQQIGQLFSTFTELHRVGVHNAEGSHPKKAKHSQLARQTNKKQKTTLTTLTTLSWVYLRSYNYKQFDNFMPT